MHNIRLYLSPLDATHMMVNVEGSSVAGEGSVTTLLPFDGDAKKRILIFKILANKALETSRFEPTSFFKDEIDWMSKHKLLDEEQQDFTSTFQQQIGQMLYSSLFPENSTVRSLLEKAISATQLKSKQLHLQIKAEHDKGHLVPFFDYPWELLHDGVEYLAASGVAISRYIRYEQAPHDLPQVQQINVLLICSRAYDIDNKLFKLPEEGFEQVRESLEEVAQDELISLEVLQKASYRELGKYLTEHQGEEGPQVIHFDGHGLIGRRCSNQSCRKVRAGVNPGTCTCGAKLDEPEGFLLFEDDQDPDTADYIGAQNLARKVLLANLNDKGEEQTGVVLIVLSACQSGVSLGADSVFNGVAQSLIRAQTPAVVGMQSSVCVEGAARFTDIFYRSLNQLDSLLDALTRSRDAMGFDDNQWYRPVLYFRSLDDKGGNIFANPKGPLKRRKKASHPLLDSAFQYHAEMFKEQSELCTIYHWFDTGNVIGRDRCTYAARFLNTIEGIIQKFSAVLRGAASAEPGDDLVQFRYSLVTPLDTSVTLIRKLAKLLPAFSNIDPRSSVRILRQDEISKALCELIEKLREADIHIALYEALLNVKPVRLKRLYLKLGVSYNKDVLVDSYEMKISELIEYSKDKGTYEELIQEVLVEYPAGCDN